ncbi:M20/M25/M40 family metallo-hydrolase [Deltaproteobacteria bacterium TL4]
MIDITCNQNFVDEFWDSKIIPALIEYIKIPNKSPHFDPDWEAKGHMRDSFNLAKNWLEANAPSPSKLYVGELKGRTPLLLLEIPGTIEETVLMYGHLDKQPEMEGWSPSRGPWLPSLEDGKLYGRGGADDGYALFASVCAVKSIQKQNLAHPSIIILIEFSEESGSPDLPAYMDHFEALIGIPDLIICLDSGAGNFEQFWNTTSLRGLVGGTLRVDVLDEGVHSGDASGIVPSSFRIIQLLLSRIENKETGRIFPDFLNVKIPQERVEQAKQVAKVLNDQVYLRFPLVSGMKPMDSDIVELILNRTWRSALSITGQEGLPFCNDGGNVLRPYTTLKLSLRIPPTLSPQEVQHYLEKVFSEKAPQGAKVTAHFPNLAAGWQAPPLTSELQQLIEKTSLAYFEKPSLSMGEGGSIPFMNILSKKFPRAHFIITGVLGPHSNAHGPNEFLHIPYVKKLTSCIAHILSQL